MLCDVLGEKLEKKIAKKSWLNTKCTMKTWQKSFVGAFLMRYKGVNGGYTRILDLMCEALHVDFIKWSDLTKVHLRAISDHFYEVVSPNTANTYVHVLEAVLNEYSDENILPVSTPKGIMKSKKVPSQHVALTQEEVERIEAYVPKNDVERDVKALFMRACYTGARCSDAAAMSDKNIIHTPKGDLLSYVSEKTKVETVLPLHSKLRKYLSYHLTKEHSSKVNSEKIKKICRAVGITEPVSLFVGGKRQDMEKCDFVTMHSGRRTFCTILARKNVNVETIRSLAGHTSSAMTDRYIMLDGKNPGKDAMSFFNEK